MEKINLALIYDLGFKLDNLANITYRKSNRTTIWMEAINVLSLMSLLFEKFPNLPACKTKRDELQDAKTKGGNWFAGLESLEDSECEKEDKEADEIFGKTVNIAKECEIVLYAELPTLAIYNITQKGIYSTNDLIEQAEGILPKHVLKRIGEMAKTEVRESGKCLALDCATASAFHMMRATEEVMYRYYISVCKPQPEKKLENWGAYIKELNKSNKSEVKEVVAMLQQIKDRHRNLIMHPEIVLSIDEAFTLFEIAQGAIIAMADKIPARSSQLGGKRVSTK